MKLIPETLDNVSWSGKPIKDLTREELELAFLGILQLYFFERENRERLEKFDKTFGGAPMPAVNPWLKGKWFK